MKRLKRISALLTVLCMSAFGVHYIVLTALGTIQPTLSTWLLFSIACSLSFWTYWSTEMHSFAGNIANTVDLILTWSILVCLMALGTQSGHLFRLIDMLCLIASFAILLGWRMSGKHTVANIAIQIVMVVAYLPTFYSLLTATGMPESMTSWMIGWLGGAFALSSAILARDRLAILYAFRAFASLSFMLLLLFLRA